jgi:hypothetical protein
MGTSAKPEEIFKSPVDFNRRRHQCTISKPLGKDGVFVFCRGELELAIWDPCKGFVARKRSNSESLEYGQITTVSGPRANSVVTWGVEGPIPPPLYVLSWDSSTGEITEEEVDDSLLRSILGSGLNSKFTVVHETLQAAMEMGLYGVLLEAVDQSSCKLLLFVVDVSSSPPRLVPRQEYSVPVKRPWSLTLRDHDRKVEETRTSIVFQS